MSAAVQFSPGFSKSLRKSCGREGGRDGNAIAPSRRSADGHGLRDREKRKEKRERSDLGKVLCAIHVRPFSPFSLIETSLLSAKRSQLSAWMAPDQKLGPSLLSPPSSSHIPISSDGGIPACIQGGGPGRAEEGIFPTEKRDRPLEPDYSEAARHA